MDVTVCTYNILAPIFTRAQYYPGTPPEFLDENARWKLIAELLKGGDCDVYCLQEVQETWVGLIVQLMHGGYEHFYFARDEKTRMRVGLMMLWKKKFNRVSAFGIRALGGGWRVAAKVVLEMDGKKFSVVTTHLEGKPDADEMRLKEIGTVLEHVGENDNVIVTGDFNTTPDSTTFAAMVKNGYASCCAPNFTFHTTTTKKIYDYIFVRGNFQLVNSKHVEDVEPLPNSRQGSDHYPLFAVVKLV